MAAITVAWTEFASSALDPDSPLDTVLVTGLFNDAKYVREWLGASYYAGAVQNHSHDGSDSTLVEIGPNALRNGSFESGTAGWTLTNYTGGSNAISTSVRQHGAKSLAFTSTVLANGGGDALSNEFRTVAGGKYYPVEVWIGASVANVSAKAQIVWYDAAQAQISTSDIANLTNTPTAMTQYGTSLQAPSTARYAKIKIIGGVPGAGSATGTVYFDGFVLGDIPYRSIVQSMLAAAAVGQAELKTTDGDVTTTVSAHLTLPGGAYGFYPRVLDFTSNTQEVTSQLTSSLDLPTAPANTSTIYIGFIGGPSGLMGASQRYVSASRPYDLGDGEVLFFVFLVMSTDGSIHMSYTATEAPWHYNGPTVIRPDYYDGKKRGWRRMKQLFAEHTTIKAALAAGLTPAEILRRLRDDPVVDVEITQAIKQADMPLIPHPFQGNNLTGKTIVLLDPVSPLMEHFSIMRENGESLTNVLRDWMTIGNTALPRLGPPGVMVVGARLK